MAGISSVWRKWNNAAGRWIFWHHYAGNVECAHFCIGSWCGSRKFLKYVSNKADFIVGVDPSKAIFAAADLLGENDKIVLVKASANDLPFKNESFDFVYSIGVCIISRYIKLCRLVWTKQKKVVISSLNLYYALDNRESFFRSLYKFSQFLRLGICKTSSKTKEAICDILAVTAYMPWFYLNRFLKQLGIGKNSEVKSPLWLSKIKVLLHQSRNDSLDAVWNSAGATVYKKADPRKWWREPAWQK